MLNDTDSLRIEDSPQFAAESFNFYQLNKLVDQPKWAQIYLIYVYPKKQYKKNILEMSENSSR
jgi:hypothetical protein